jgi:hypothetical protein
VTSSGGVLSATLVSDASGQVFGSLQTSASDQPGVYSASLTGTLSGALATATFTVSPGATATPMPALPPTAVPATATPSEPYGVFLANDEVLVGRRTDLENTATCNLRGWGLDCNRKVKDAVSLSQVLGPFPTSEAARQAFCAALVPGSWRVVPLGAGSKARFSFAGQELWVNNVPSC